MVYKTTAKIQNGKLSLIDGLLHNLGDHIIAYNSLLMMVREHGLKKDRDFQINKLPNTAIFGERLRVTFSQPVTALAIRALKKEYPDLIIENLEQMESSQPLSNAQ